MDQQQRIFDEQLATGKSEVYAQAYASKYSQGAVFARHFATLREKRYNQKLAAAATVSGVIPEKKQDGGPVVRLATDWVGPNAAKTEPDTKTTADDRSKTFSSQQRNADIRKRTPNDFIIMKSIGSGSYSTVHLAKERESDVTYAMKILEKAHIVKEKKEKYVMIEREVFGSLFFSPFITKLFYTFQDTQKLYFVMEFAQNGELLGWIKKLGSFDEECTRFYSAEILMALEHMHSKNIIHRDLKPENILLSDKMHIKICDFGTAKIMTDEEEQGGANSFVGTAQYVSPELLDTKKTCKGSDIWALGCIIYQLLSGDFPFRAGNEYQTFKKISALDYEIPQGFDEIGKELVEKILVIDPEDRLGSKKHGGIETLKQHPFWKGLPCEWDQIHTWVPPELDDFLPAMSRNEESLHGRDAVDVDIDDLLAAAYKTSTTGSLSIEKRKREEKETMMKVQEQKSPWHGFCNPDELILKTGLVDKRKGLFSKRRQFVMTDTPRLFYIDPVSLAVMGEIPWSSDLMPQYKTPKTFFIHTPERTYYLDDVEKAAITWVDAIQRLLKMSNEK